MEAINLSTIRFHIKTGANGWLSNFAPYPIVVDRIQWPTSEHFYQANKFTNDPEWMEAIRGSRGPYEAWRMGRSSDHPQRSDWNEVKESVMITAVRSKFEQHSDLQSFLLETEHAVLIEHAPNDAFWGNGGDGSGENRLGKILMMIRAELQT